MHVRLSLAALPLARETTLTTRAGCHSPPRLFPERFDTAGSADSFGIMVVALNPASNPASGPRGSQAPRGPPRCSPWRRRLLAFAAEPVTAYPSDPSA